MKTNYYALSTKTRAAILAVVLSLALSCVAYAGLAKAATMNQASIIFNDPLLLNQGMTNAKTSTLTGDVTAGADLRVGDLVGLTAQTAITVSGDSTITPLGSYQPLAASSTITQTGTSDVDTDGLTAGDMVIFINVTTPTITLTDTGTLKLSGNAALGQYDNITLLFDGTNLVETSQVDN